MSTQQPTRNTQLEYQITSGNGALLHIANQHRDDIILVDFYADWCGPCKAIAPLVHKLVEYYANKPGCRRLVLCKVNVEEEGNEDLSAAYKVRAMPTFVWISNMNQLERMEGADSKKLAQITDNLCILRADEP